jgi:WD40 repeat protein
VESVCFSGDGQLLYWGDYEGAIERWTWGSGERSLIRDQHDSPSSVIRLLGEHWLLCGVGGASDPVPIEVWNLAEGRIEQYLDGHLFGVGDLALIPGTQRFVSAGDSTLRIWDLGVPGAIRLTTLEPEVDRVAFREPQGWVITAAETSDTVWVRTLADGRLVLKLEVHPEPVSAMALSHDGRWFASGIADGSVRLWDLDSGQWSWQTRHHKAKVTAVAFSPDGRMLATGAEDGRVNLVATEDGELIKHSKAHRNDSVHSLAVSNNGRLVAWGGYSNLEILDVDSLKVVRKLETVTHYALWFAPDDEFLVAEGMSQFGLAWKIATGERLLDGEILRALYDTAMLRAGRPWQWHSPGNIGYAQEYLKLIDARSGAAVAAFPELQGEVRWHPGGRIWLNKRSRQVSLVQLEGPQGP